MGILSSEHKSFMVVDFGGLKGVLTCSVSLRKEGREECCFHFFLDISSVGT